MIDYTLNLKPGDKVTILYSPYVWTIKAIDGSNIRCKASGVRDSSFILADVLSIIERKSR